jgi:hypothetical protein
MTDEGRPAGHLLSRREVLTLLGATGAAWFMTGSANPRRADAGTLGPSCIVRPEQTEGPYFIDERLHRSDIRSNPTDGRIRPGSPLTLTLLVSRLNAGDCQPLPGAQVDIWHCAGSLLRCAGSSFRHDRPEVHAWLSDHRCAWRDSIHHCVPWLVSGPDGTHSLQDSHRAYSSTKLRVHVPIVLRRYLDGSRPCCPSVCRKRPPHRAESA